VIIGGFPFNLTPEFFNKTLEIIPAMVRGEMRLKENAEMKTYLLMQMRQDNQSGPDCVCGRKEYNGCWCHTDDSLECGNGEQCQCWCNGAR
jgi:hypothetical protein